MPPPRKRRATAPAAAASSAAAAAPAAAPAGVLCPGVRVLSDEELRARASLLGGAKLPKSEDCIGEGVGDNVQILERDLQYLEAKFGASPLGCARSARS